MLRTIEAANERREVDEKVSTVFNSLDLDTNGYSVSYIRDEVNKDLPADLLLDNRKIKVLLLRGVNLFFF